MHGDLLLRCAQRSTAAASRVAIRYWVAHGDPLLGRARRSTAGSCTAIRCCVARGNPMLCVVHCVAHGDASRAANGTGHGDAMGVHGGMQRSAHAVPAPTESPASVELAGGAEEATIAESEALVLEAKSSTWSGLEMPLPPSMGHGACSRDGHGVCSRDGHGARSRDGHDAARAGGIDMFCPRHVSSPSWPLVVGTAARWRGARCGACGWHRRVLSSPRVVALVAVGKWQVVGPSGPGP
jgi:hypothetical protein